MTEIIYKLVTRVSQYFCFPDRPMKGGDILDFQKVGNLRKGGGGVDLEKVGMTPLTNLLVEQYMPKGPEDLIFLGSKSLF